MIGILEDKYIVLTLIIFSYYLSKSIKKNILVVFQIEKLKQN